MQLKTGGLLSGNEMNGENAENQVSNLFERVLLYLWELEEARSGVQLSPRSPAPAMLKQRMALVMRTYIRKVHIYARSQGSMLADTRLIRNFFATEEGRDAVLASSCIPKLEGVSVETLFSRFSGDLLAPVPASTVTPSAAARRARFPAAFPAVRRRSARLLPRLSAGLPAPLPASTVTPSAAARSIHSQAAFPKVRRHSAMPSPAKSPVRAPRRRSCRHCAACLRRDCGNCKHCINKKHKKPCVQRQCENLRSAASARRKRLQRCKKCSECRRPDCLQCATCKDRYSGEGKLNRCCLLRVCNNMAY